MLGGTAVLMGAEGARMTACKRWGCPVRTNDRPGIVRQETRCTRPVAYTPRQPMPPCCWPTVQSSFWLTASEGNVLLPSASELAAGDQALASPDAWKGCIWGTNAIYEGQASGGLSQLLDASVHAQLPPTCQLTFSPPVTMLESCNAARLLLGGGHSGWAGIA